MLRTIVCALAMMLALPAHAAEQQPELLARSDKWLADYDRDGCHLYAQFGTGDAMVLARFTRYEPGVAFDFTVFGKRFTSTGPRRSGDVDFGLPDKPGRIEAITGTSGTTKMAIFSGITLRGKGWRSDKEQVVTPEQEAATTGVTIAMQGQRPVRLDFGGSLGGPMVQMRKCMIALVKSWGYDPAEQERRTRTPVPRSDPMYWLGPNDYPKRALASMNNGLVQFRLDVDARGAVAGCHVLARTNPDEFADTTCRVISKRAQFEPAMNAAGQPIPSYYIRKVLWSIGG